MSLNLEIDPLETFDSTSMFVFEDLALTLAAHLCQSRGFVRLHFLIREDFIHMIDQVKNLVENANHFELSIASLLLFLWLFLRKIDTRFLEIP